MYIHSTAGRSFTGLHLGWNSWSFRYMPSRVTLRRAIQRQCHAVMFWARSILFHRAERIFVWWVGGLSGDRPNETPNGVGEGETSGTPAYYTTHHEAVGRMGRIISSFFMKLATNTDTNTNTRTSYNCCDISDM